MGDSIIDANALEKLLSKEFSSQISSLKSKIRRRDKKIAGLQENIENLKRELTDKEIEMVNLEELKPVKKLYDMFQRVRKDSDYNVQAIINMAGFQVDLNDVSIPSDKEARNVPFEQPPVWFYAANRYYKSKREILDFLKVFGYKIPDWAYKFKMPQEYSADELIAILTNPSKLCCTNSTDFNKGNFPFWWRTLSIDGLGRHGVCKIFLDGSNSFSFYCSIPLQWLFKNPLFINDDRVFDKFIEVLDNHTHMRYRNISTKLLKIREYQEIPSEKILKLLVREGAKGLLLSKFAEGEHGIEVFKKNYSRDFNDSVQMILFKNASHRGGFDFMKFPPKYQYKYLKEKLERENPSDKAYYILRSEITVEQKKELMSQLDLTYDYKEEAEEKNRGW